MGIVRRYWELIKLLFRYVRFKIRQTRLKTSEKFVVTTTYGPIKGVKRISIWNDPFYSFEKIPFAKPPLGDLRFKAPVPPDPWTEILDCTKEGPVPMQTNLISKRMEGSEDCLYLNVYTKNLKPDQLMPVMVWIYGGGFENGGATKDLYSPDYFMQKEVVLITITYRVGPFGFLSLKDPDLQIPGNAGLKDQVLALKWTKQNCPMFGGNPDNITVFGESAGGASTHYMTITDQTKGLFHKAILMSGSAVCSWALNTDHETTYPLAKAMGYQGVNDDKKIFEFIKNSDAINFLKAERKILTPEHKKKSILLAFCPVIEPYLSEDCVVPEEPRLMMRKAWTNDIPIMIGGTSDEGLLFYAETKMNPDSVNKLGNCTDMVPLELNLNENSTECLDYGLKLRKAYFRGNEPNMANIHQYLELMGHKLIWHGLHRTLLSRLIYAPNAPTYFYRFNVDSKYFNWFRSLTCGHKMRGVAHADDLGYLFLNMFMPTLKPNCPEYNAIQEFIGAFVSFANTSNPNTKAFKSHIDWKPLKKDDDPMICLNFSFDTQIIPFPDSEKMKLWDSFYSQDSLI